MPEDQTPEQQVASLTEQLASMTSERDELKKSESALTASNEKLTTANAGLLEQVEAGSAVSTDLKASQLKVERLTKAGEAKDDEIAGLTTRATDAEGAHLSVHRNAVKDRFNLPDEAVAELDHAALDAVEKTAPTIAEAAGANGNGNGNGNPGSGFGLEASGTGENEPADQFSEAKATVAKAKENAKR